MATKAKSVSRPTQRIAQHSVEPRSDGDTSSHQPDEQSQDVHTRISELAYARDEERGRNDGNAVEDWLKAEQQLLKKV